MRAVGLGGVQPAKAQWAGGNGMLTHRPKSIFSASRPAYRRTTTKVFQGGEEPTYQGVYGPWKITQQDLIEVSH